MVLFVRIKKNWFVKLGKLCIVSLKKSRKLNLPIDLQLQLFDAMVLPILMYGCEIWGVGNNSIIESFCVKFYKTILGLKKSTPNCILYGELGRFPIEIFIKCRIVAFWKRIICEKQDKIAATLYKLMHSMHIKHFFHSDWIVFVENVLNDCELSEYWLSQDLPKICHYLILLNKDYLININKHGGLMFIIRQNVLITESLRLPISLRNI